MARGLRDARIDSRTARLKLVPRGEPYWSKLTKGCYVGYRKGKGSGSWVARWRSPSGDELQKTLGAADGGARVRAFGEELRRAADP